MAYLLMLFSSAIAQAEGICIKKYNSKHARGSFMFTAMICTFSLLSFLAREIFLDPGEMQFLPELLPYAALSGICYFLGTILTYFALQIGSFALTRLIISYSLMFTTGYGILFLGEDVTVFKCIGIVCIALSLFFLRAKNTDKSKSFSFKWLAFTVISCIANGGIGILSRMQQIRFDNGVTNEFMVIALTLSAVTLGIFGIVKEKKQAWGSFKTCLPYAIGAGMSNGMTNMMSMFVNTLIPISIAAPTRSAVKNILSMGVSMAIFKEKFLPRQIVGVALGAVAVVLLNL